ncbi:unnamed protein product [Scytosiphon promiscuus]
MMSRSIFGRCAIFLAGIVSARGGVVDVTGENFFSMVDGSANVLLEFYAPWCGHCKKLAPEYEELGEQFDKEKDGIMIAKVDAAAHAATAGLFGVTGYPTLKWMPKGKSLPKDAETVNAPRSADGLGKWIAEKTGVQPTKPAEAPSAVLDLTRDTFDSIVMDPTKHALVEFFAPWCGHCKSLAPVYEKLGRVFEAESSVVVAKVDAVEEKDLGNRFGVSGFPTLKYFPAGHDRVEPEAYGGGRDLESMVEFINTKAGTSRTPDGGLADGAGRLEALDAVLASCCAGAADPVAQLKTSLEEAVSKAGYREGSDEAATAGHYVRAAQKLSDKGKGYLFTELKRLEGMLGGGAAGSTISPQKRTLFMVRSNILRAFVEFGFGDVEAVAGAEGTGEGAGAKAEL